MKDTKKVYVILSAAVLLMLIIAELMTAIAILRMDMLPGAYAAVIIGMFVLFAAGTGLLLFLPGKEKKVGTVRRVFASVLALVIVCGCALVTKVVTEAHDTINTVTTPTANTNTRNMYVLVRADDRAQVLADAADYPFGLVQDYDIEHTEMAVELINTQLGKEMAMTSYETFTELANALYTGDVDAVIMNGVSVAILMEEEEYEDFSENVKILLTIPLTELEEEEPTQPTEETEPKDPEKNITNTPFVVYISGSDTRSLSLDVSRSDVNILAVVNPVTKQVLLINTPRDSYVPNPAGKGRYDKLTHCGLYGVDCSMEALEGLYGLDVNYYGQINFTGFKTLVDAVGGVTVYSDQAFKAGTTYISKGENNLDGAGALAFARERYRVSGGDNGRGQNQMKVIKAVLEKMTSGTTIISKYTSIMNSLEGMFTTNISTNDISLLVKMQLGDMAKWNIQSIAVTGTGGSEKTYSMPGSYAYVMYLNKDRVAQVAELAQRVLAGESITAADVQ